MTTTDQWLYHADEIHVDDDEYDVVSHAFLWILQGDPVQDKLYEASAMHNVAVGKWSPGALDRDWT